MLSVKQEPANTNDIDVNKPWGSKEELDWLLNTSEVNLEHQEEASANVIDQQTMTPQSWEQEPSSYVYQSSNSPSHGSPVYKFTVLQGSSRHPASSPYFRSNVVANTQHQACITLVPTSDSFRPIVKHKRKRTMFTTEQIEYLETVFSRKQYVTREERQVLVNQLKVSDSAVKVWFQNRRIRSKRELEQAYYEANSPLEEVDQYYMLEHMESKLFQKVDEFGFVTLDEEEMEFIVSAIDSVLSSDVSLELESKDSDQSTAESESSSSIYEPISPAASDVMDEDNIEETSRWQPDVAPEQSLQKLFDLHFC